jgi:DNA repair protein RadC
LHSHSSLLLANAIERESVLIKKIIAHGQKSQLIFKKKILLSTSAAIILVHNHPADDPSPGREGSDITWRLSEAGEM